MTYAAISKLRAAPYLKQVAVGATPDADLQAVLDRAEEIVNDALGFVFAAWALAATTRDVECRHGGRWLELPYHKAASVTAVKAISGRGTTDESTETITDWLEESDGRLYADAGHSSTTWYRVTAIWGYGPAPANIVEAELEIAVNIWMGGDAGNSQNTVGVDGQGARSFNRALTWAQRSIIDGVRARYLGVVHA